MGRRGRSRLVAVYDFSAEAGGTTRVAADHLQRARQLGRPDQADRRPPVGARQSKKALRRLKEQLEEPGRTPLKRVTVAGYEPVKAPRFGAHVPVEHQSAPADG